MTWLSIITVVRDDESGLSRTRDAIEVNDRNGVEWVVIDSSHDRAAIKTLVDGIGRYEWVPPEGIYPAMNHALDLAAGEYVLFLNAGDELYSPDTVTSVRKAITKSSCSWAYGQIEIIEDTGATIMSSLKDYHAEKQYFFARGSFPPHQGTFARVSDLRALGGFDPSYSIAADYKAFLQLTQQSDPLVLSSVIARFPAGGASSQHWFQALGEFHRARVEVLAPSGGAALRERALTVVHAARTSAYRLVVERARRWARR